MARVSSVVLVSALLAILLIAAAVPTAESTITCGSVASQLSQCVKYITGKGPLVPGCCSGAKSLSLAANTTPARQAVCNCLKTYTKSIPGVNYGNVASIPGKCGVSTPYPISPATDCSKVH